MFSKSVTELSSRFVSARYIIYRSGSCIKMKFEVNKRGGVGCVVVRQ